MRFPASKIDLYMKQSDFAEIRANISLLSGDKLVELILEHYEKLPKRVREWIPLKRVWIPDTEK